MSEDIHKDAYEKSEPTGEGMEYVPGHGWKRIHLDPADLKSSKRFIIKDGVYVEIPGPIPMRQ